MSVLLIGGYIGNATTDYVHQEGRPTLLLLWELHKNGMSFAAIAYVAMSVISGKRTIAGWGFTLDRWTPVSLGLVMGLLLLGGDQVRNPLHCGSPMVFSFVLYAVSEELICRVLLINSLITVFGTSKRGVFSAILISSIVFALVHIPIRSLGEVQGLAMASLLLGYVYYLTRSILFPALIHVIANTIDKSGYFGGAIMLLLYVVLALAGRVRNRHHDQSYRET